MIEENNREPGIEANIENTLTLSSAIKTFSIIWKLELK